MWKTCGKGKHKWQITKWKNGRGETQYCPVCNNTNWCFYAEDRFESPIVTQESCECKCESEPHYPTHI